MFTAAFLIARTIAGEVSMRAGRLLRLGMRLLAAAVVVDAGMSVTADPEARGMAWPQSLRLTIEESLELSGWILVSATLTAVVCLALLNGRSRSGAS